MVDNEPHAVVRLLVKRMESHPEEFNNGDGRWAQWLDELMPFVTEKERVMLRKPIMQTIHEDVMDELLNGPEKRRKYEEDREYERHLAQALQHTKQQALQRNNQMSAQQAMQQKMQQQAQLGQYQSQLGQYGAAAQGFLGGGQAQGIVGKSPTSVIMDEYASIGSGTDTFAAPQPQPEPNYINQIKQALGIKK